MKLKTLFVVMACVALSSCNTKQADVNPFFTEWNTPFGVPPFEEIRLDHFVPAIDSAMVILQTEFDVLVNNPEPATFKNTIVAYDRAGKMLGDVMGVFSGIDSSEEKDELEMELAPKVSAMMDKLTLNPKLFERIKYVYDNRESENLNDEEKFMLENIYAGFVRNGALLNEDEKNKLMQLNQEIQINSIKFDQNLLAETNAFMLVIDNSDDLAGLPQVVVDMAAETAKAKGLDGKWVFTTHKPSMIPFLQYSEKRDLRKKLYDGYIKRANNDNENDNKAVVTNIIALKAEKAKLLGYKTYADFQLERRMAQTPANVDKLMKQLWDGALPVAKRELAEMQAIADAEGANFALESYDWWYYAEKLRKEKYNLDENELKPYFKLENVRDGAFAVANKLYGITFTPIAEIPRPHPDAQAFEVKDNDGSHLGVLYMDFHPRAGKGQGAWCGGFREHEILDGKVITPIVSIVCNFTPASGDTPSLLNLDEAETLFHEFGHALQSLFSINEYSSTSAPMDIIELPSQIMEHWVVEPEVLDMFAKHYQTGEPMPQELKDRLINSSFFNTGFDNVELFAATMLDMAYYSLEAPVSFEVPQFEKDFFAKIGLIKEIEPRYHTTYFGHIISGYDAGYYVYTWAAVYEHDAFEAFKEKGIFDQATATSFRENVLAKMGIEDATQSYINFRGRDADIEPLLRNKGLK